MTSARSTLLDKVIAHAAAHGIGDSSLRELATAVGSSHRMLIYHFGSSDGLIAAIATAIEQQQRDMLGRLAVTSTSPGEMILAQWYALIQPDTLQFVRVFFEVLPTRSTDAQEPNDFSSRLSNRGSKQASTPQPTSA